MAEWLRNPEVRLQTGIHGVLLVTAAAAAAIIWDIGCALYAAALCLAGSGISLWLDRKSTRLNSSHVSESRMPSSA